MIARSVATVACLICLTAFIGRAAAQPNVEVPAAMQLHFLLGVERVVAARSVNDATSIDCRTFFPEFERAKDLGPIVAFFRSKGVEPKRAHQNVHSRTFFMTYFELPSATLVSLGFPPLRPADRLFFIFNTDKPPSNAITYFSAAVAGPEITPFWTTDP
jgi:hypothetical protein